MEFMGAIYSNGHIQQEKIHCTELGGGLWKQLLAEYWSYKQHLLSSGREKEACIENEKSDSKEKVTTNHISNP